MLCICESSGFCPEGVEGFCPCHNTMLSEQQKQIKNKFSQLRHIVHKIMIWNWNYLGMVHWLTQWASQVSLLNFRFQIFKSLSQGLRSRILSGGACDKSMPSCILKVCCHILKVCHHTTSVLEGSCFNVISGKKCGVVAPPTPPYLLVSIFLFPKTEEIRKIRKPKLTSTPLKNDIIFRHTGRSIKKQLKLITAAAPLAHGSPF